MKRIRWEVLLAFMLVAPTAAWSQPQESHSHDDASQNPEWSQLIAGMAAMHAAMASLTPSGNSDVDFVRLMLPHHQAALDMARTQLMYGKDPQMRRLAQEIIADQQSEIELMQLWLKQHEASSHSPDQKPPISSRQEH